MGRSHGSWAVEETIWTCLGIIRDDGKRRSSGLPLVPEFDEELRAQVKFPLLREWPL